MSLKLFMTLYIFFIVLFYFDLYSFYKDHACGSDRLIYFMDLFKKNVYFVSYFRCCLVSLLISFCFVFFSVMIVY